MRADLPPASQLVQAAHACLAGGQRFGPPDGCHLVVLAVESAGEVLPAGALAEHAGIRCAVFEDETPAVTAPCSDTDCL